MAKLAKGIKRKLTGNNPELKIDFKQLTGVDLSNFPVMKESISQDILDKILERTADGDSWNGRKFKSPYSKQYQATDEFKAFGKSANKVNLNLTGGMLGLMDVKETSGKDATIGWFDREEAAKAHGHITGAPDGPKVKRDFFGINESEAKQILREYGRDLAAIRDTIAGDKKASEQRTQLQNRILGFIQALRSGSDEG